MLSFVRNTLEIERDVLFIHDITLIVISLEDFDIKFPILLH